MDEIAIRDGSNPTRGMLYDEFKIISKGMGSIVLRMDEKMSEQNRKNIKEYGLKFQKKKGTDTPLLYLHYKAGCQILFETLIVSK